MDNQGSTSLSALKRPLLLRTSSGIPPTKQRCPDQMDLSNPLLLSSGTTRTTGGLFAISGSSVRSPISLTPLTSASKTGKRKELLNSVLEERSRSGFATSLSLRGRTENKLLSASYGRLSLQPSLRSTTTTLTTLSSSVRTSLTPNKLTPIPRSEKLDTAKVDHEPISTSPMVDYSSTFRSPVTSEPPPEIPDPVQHDASLRRNELIKNKVRGIISNPLGQTHILASRTLLSLETCFVLLDSEKLGWTYEQ